MPRLARKELKTPFLHVMVQGINKEYIFSKKIYIETYLQLIHKYKQKFPITIIAYCIMNNHAHLLVHVEDIKVLGKFMHIINLIYSQFYNRENQRTGVLFRNKYQSEPIYDKRYLINCINYIHMNPVKANMVKDCKDYPYSTYNDYLNNIGICKSKLMTEIFGANYNYNNLFVTSPNSLFIDIDSPSFSEIQSLMDSRIIRIFK